MPTVLEGKRVYLSGPIEYGDGPNWRIEPKNILTQRFGLNIFDPFEDPKQQMVAELKEAKKNLNFEKMAQIIEYFVQKDLSMTDRSDILIACLPQGVPTTGTHHEIINANDRKKALILLCEQGKENIPLWYYGFISHKRMFGSWNEVYNYLEEVNLGLHLDDRRFSFIYNYSPDLAHLSSQYTLKRTAISNSV